ncbi:hypothetical protein TRV_06249 [Trichophyton verrucosum HKI 0517]|uniref:Uncharacterized protein n=1 Tax=Trichophyton verrucosum (strain HKI 0517) TaxID=663202 RepID=D4DGE6_TRIVH|nr:uncharacterized protein TRV_06249 [Trichophyton verrucosum HKI 0517]EFE39079.1 hypothetical protein TRV_06249 [Trichophyton verrucosum HKI 0517]
MLEEKMEKKMFGEGEEVAGMQMQTSRDRDMHRKRQTEGKEQE